MTLSTSQNLTNFLPNGEQIIKRNRSKIVLRNKRKQKFDESQDLSTSRDRFQQSFHNDQASTQRRLKRRKADRDASH